MSHTFPPADTDVAPLPPISRRERFPITEEEDQPLDNISGTYYEGCGDSPDIKTIEARDQEHKHKVEDYKNVVGGVLLAVCFLIIVSFSLLDTFRHVESSLFTGAFEFAKTIATAVIGYLFATNIKGK